MPHLLLLSPFFPHIILLLLLLLNFTLVLNAGQGCLDRSCIPHTCLEASAFGSGIHLPSVFRAVGHILQSVGYAEETTNSLIYSQKCYWTITVHQLLCCLLRSSCDYDRFSEHFRAFSDTSLYPGSALRHEQAWLIDSKKEWPLRRASVFWTLSSFFVEPWFWSSTDSSGRSC